MILYFFFSPLASHKMAYIQNKSFEVKMQELQYFDIFSLIKNLKMLRDNNVSEKEKEILKLLNAIRWWLLE